MKNNTKKRPEGAKYPSVIEIELKNLLQMWVSGHDPAVAIPFLKGDPPERFRHLPLADIESGMSAMVGQPFVDFHNRKFTIQPQKGLDGNNFSIKWIVPLEKRLDELKVTFDGKRDIERLSNIAIGKIRFLIIHGLGNPLAGAVARITANPLLRASMFEGAEYKGLDIQNGIWILDYEKLLESQGTSSDFSQATNEAVAQVIKGSARMIVIGSFRKISLPPELMAIAEVVKLNLEITTERGQPR